MNTMIKLIRSKGGRITRMFPAKDPIIIDAEFRTDRIAFEAYFRIIREDADARVEGNKIHVVMD